jgi:hypothetical protein
LDPKSRKITGDPLPLEELLDIAEIDIEDIENAADWWDENASLEWEGALDSDPVEDDR